MRCRSRVKKGTRPGIKRLLPGGNFPLGLGRQTGIGPVGIGIGLVTADVANRLIRLPLLQAIQREFHRLTL